MVNENLLNVVMLIEIGLLILAVGVFFTHGLWLFVTQKRSRRQMKAARESLAQLLNRGTINVEEIEALRLIPRDVQVMVFLEISRNLTGTGKERLRFVAREVSLLDRARKLCESKRWTRRLHGARLLARMDVADPIVRSCSPIPTRVAHSGRVAAAQPSASVISACCKCWRIPRPGALRGSGALLRMGVLSPSLSLLFGDPSGLPAESGLRVAESAETRFLPAALRHSARRMPVSGLQRRACLVHRCAARQND